jgi:hypothetical protein
MEEKAAYVQIGQFIVKFQRVEEQLIDLLELTCVTKTDRETIALNGFIHADEEFVRIIKDERTYSKRVKATDTRFARFVDQLPVPDQSVKQRFHDLMTELLGLGNRRNKIVHSTYAPYISVDGQFGLRRKQAPKAGQREGQEEDLLPESLAGDLKSLDAAHQSFEAFRSQILDWLYGEDA